MFLHVLADTLGSVAVIFSTYMIQLTEWYWIDPLCSLFLSGIFILNVLFLFLNLYL